MNFLNPLFLAGLATAVIPVLIYLWTRKNRKTIQFSSIFLFKRIEASAIRSLKVTEWLLVFLRMTALVFLVLGFSQPFFSSSEPQIMSQSLTHIVMDESPEFYFNDGQNKKPELKQEADQLIQSILAANPAVQVLSTDSLTNFAYLSGPSDEPSLFHGVPAALKTIDSLESEKVAVLTKNGSWLQNRLISQHKNYRFILMEDDQFTKNAGITEVNYPNVIWQTGEANSVEVVVENFDKLPVRFSMECWVDRQLIQTQSVEMESGQRKILIPVQVYKRGWHELQLKINTTDFLVDNEWNGGFYLPERLNMQVKVNPMTSSLSSAALENSARSAGLIVQPQSESQAVIIVQSSQLQSPLTTLAELNTGIIWLPDFGAPEQTRNQLAELGIAVTSFSDQPVRLKYLSKHDFWNFVKTENPDLLSNSESTGLVDISLSPGHAVLAYSADQKPVLLMTQVKGKQVLIFLTNPFVKGKPIPVWALTTVFHGLNVLNQPVTTNGGFSALQVKQSHKLSVPAVPGRLLVEWSDRQIEISAAGKQQHYLPQQILNKTGRLTLQFQGEIVQKSGVNYRFSGFENSSQPDGAVVIKSSSKLSDLTKQDNRSLSVLFFVLSLLCFLAESLISNVRLFLPKA